MPEPVHAYVKANGQDIKGESTIKSMGRADSIECVTFNHAVNSAREAATGMVTGRRQFSPILVTKRIDKASPLLMKALSKSEKIDAIFKFFRPSLKGDGTTEQFYTIEISEGNIASVKTIVSDALKAEQHMEPPIEEVGFVFKNITWTFTDGGLSHQDKWEGE